MHKTKRQQKILSLIRARRIGTQQELTAMLDRAGFAATQSSVSRDLEELGVVKHNGHYTLPRATDGSASRSASRDSPLRSPSRLTAPPSARSSARWPARTRYSLPSASARIKGL